MRCSWCQPPSQISVLISLSTWLSHHHPPLSHRFCPTQGQICVLWPTPSTAAFIIPQPLCDRQDWSPLQQPSTLPVKGQQWKKPPRGPTEDGLMNQTCTQSFLLITEVSPGINTAWLQGATYCDLSQSPWTEGHSLQEPDQQKRASLQHSHFTLSLHTEKKGATERQRKMVEEHKEVQKWSMRDSIGREGERSNIPPCNPGQGVTRG